MGVRRLAKKDLVAGARSTERAIASGRAESVMIAKDADDKVTKRLLALCRQKGIEPHLVDSMKELGESCGLRVGASSCAILKNSGRG